MYYRMAEITFKMPVVYPTAPPSPVGFKFSWDVFFTFVLLLCVCCGVWVWITKVAQTTPNQCTPDGQSSTGVYGSDCCSTNGIDRNGNCNARSPMGVPAYGIQNSSTPQEYALSPALAPGPAAIPTPPVPNVSP
jgi:hypothetical protein